MKGFKNAFSFDLGIPLVGICSRKIIGQMQNGIPLSIFVTALFLKWHWVGNLLLPGFCVEGQTFLESFWNPLHAPPQGKRSNLLGCAQGSAASVLALRVTLPAENLSSLALCQMQLLWGRPPHTGEVFQLYLCLSRKLLNSRYCVRNLIGLHH